MQKLTKKNSARRKCLMLNQMGANIPRKKLKSSEVGPIEFAVIVLHLDNDNQRAY